MSVKFKETIQQTATNAATGGNFGFGQAGNAAKGMFGMGANGGDQKHPTRHAIGEALTRGEGKGGYLQAYIKQLQSNPLRTRMATAGGLAGLQELLASWIAQDRNKNGHYFTSRVPKMAVYGAFVSAPMGHFMIRILQWMFKDSTSVKAKIFQILISNLIISPIQNTVYLISMAIVAGARTFHQVRATVRAGFFPVMRVSWIASPLCLVFAQQFLPPETWVTFFNLVSFAIGTYISAHTKGKRLTALRKRRYEEGGRDTRTDYNRTEEGGRDTRTDYSRTETRTENIRPDIRPDMRPPGPPGAY